MEFQFGTNWSEFSRSAGGVIGQTLAMEGVFSFFLESSFLGLFLFGEKRLGPRWHWFSSLHDVPWFVAFRLFYRRHRRLDAASRRLFARGRRFLPTAKLLGLAAESWGLLAVRAHDARRRADRLFRDGGRGCLLHPFELPRGIRKAFRSHRRDRGRGRCHLSALPDRRRPGRDDCQTSARHSRGHGGRFPLAARRSRGDTGPAGSFKISASTIRC